MIQSYYYHYPPMLSSIHCLVRRRVCAHMPAVTPLEPPCFIVGPQRLDEGPASYWSQISCELRPHLRFPLSA